MANYAVTDYIIGPDVLSNVMAALEIYIETIDTSKTIRLLQVIKDGDDWYRIAILHDA